jgi:hypothetical protein
MVDGAGAVGEAGEHVLALRGAPVPGTKEKP